MLHQPLTTKTKLLNAALKLVRVQGYEATTVDALCQDAGVTKGAFFHHFRSKEELAVAASRYWSEVTDGVFANASYHQFEDPLDQLIGYIELRATLMKDRTLAESTCFLGTMAQELYTSHPAIRAACAGGISAHADDVADLVRRAKARHAPDASWSPESLAIHTQAVIQGAYVIAKAHDDVAMAVDSIRHLRRYVELLFHYAKEE